MLSVDRPANTQCVNSHCPGSSDAPTFALIALLIVAVLFVVLAMRMWRRGRQADDRLLVAVAAVLAGLAALCLLLFGSGFRHYGGAAACQAWWQEAGLPSAAQGVADDNAHVDCQRHAVDAIGPALGAGGVAGIVVGGLVMGAAAFGRRRAQPERRNVVYSDQVHTPERREQ
ncbi:hypothetical protein [uncultured Jatrophihabitans sp.]|uniref:hypothetical protein n=1 Tax=uncultured Jatrophihabitans sp. TaxID=1610747 RepID=UPI0035C9470E